MEENNLESQRAVHSPKYGSYFLGLSILTAAVLVAGSIIYSKGNESGNQNLGNIKENIGAENKEIPSAIPAIGPEDVILGDPNAPVTIFEFGDYQCPFCGRFFSETESKIRENFIKTGKVKMVYKDFAIVDTFPGVPPARKESHWAAEAAHCAKDQGKFWEYHDALYRAEVEDGAENNGNLNKDLFIKIAKDLNLNTGQFSSCFDAGKYKDAVLKSTSEAQIYGVNGTPHFFIGKEQIIGARPYADFEAVIRAELE